MGNCNDHGTFKNGKCECSWPWIGADCSFKPEEIDTRSDFENNAIELKPRNWKHFSIETRKEYVINIEGSAKLELYTLENELPTASFYDSLHKGPII